MSKEYVGRRPENNSNEVEPRPMRGNQAFFFLFLVFAEQDYELRIGCRDSMPSAWHAGPAGLKLAQSN
jgi:hypothetical protein